jgi:hypothetical protein
MAEWSLHIIETIPILITFWMIFRMERSERSAQGFQTLERVFKQLACRKVLSFVAVGLLVVLLRLALVPILGIPEPHWHDEYSYILAGKTYALGRLTNPSHPLWVHFESFHIIQRPTYMSMYPPAQGLVLALAIVLGCHPWFGVLLITAVACGALCWMLQAWVPPGWALFGGLLAAVRLGLLTYWMNSYFATSVVALGGVLVLGALPRIKKYHRLKDALVMSFGLVLLANSRPYEGFVLSLPVAGSLFWWMASSSRPSGRVLIRQVILPILLVLLVAGGCMSYYFWRVTGNPFRMPYQVNRETYAITPYFVWQKVRPEPIYHHPEMRVFYTSWELNAFLETRSVSGFIFHTLSKVKFWWAFYLGPALTIPLLAFPCIVRDKKMKFVLVASVIFFFGTVIETWTLPHYIAPAVGLIYIVLVQSARHLRLWRWRQKNAGIALVRAVPMICVFMVILRITAAALHTPVEGSWPRGNLERAQLLKFLEHTPGQHLVIVHVDALDMQGKQYVYNEPDIDSAKVVWARDMGKDKNQDLLRYFRGRQLWFLEVRPDDPVKLSHYSDSEPSN